MSETKIFAVQFSGHGSEFMPSLEDCEFNLSLKDANQIALEWEIRADTIGGATQVVTKNGIHWAAEDARKTLTKMKELPYQHP